MNRVSICAQATPGKIVCDLGGEIERGLSEDLGEIMRARIVMIGENALGPAPLNDMNDVRIRCDVPYRREQYDDWQSPGAPLDRRVCPRT